MLQSKEELQEEFLFQIAAAVLRINVALHTLSLKSKQIAMSTQLYSANPLGPPDGSREPLLDLCDSTVHILYQTGHYDILYKTEQLPGFEMQHKLDGETHKKQEALETTEARSVFVETVIDVST